MHDNFILVKVLPPDLDCLLPWHDMIEWLGSNVGYYDKDWWWVIEYGHWYIKLKDGPAATTCKLLFG